MGSLTDSAVPRTVVRGPDEIDMGSMGLDALDFGLMFATELAGLGFRFSLPEDAPREGLVLEVPDQALGVQIWAGGGWRWIDLSQGLAAMLLPVQPFGPDGVFMSAGHVFPLPSEIIDDGRVFLRVLLRSGVWNAFNSVWKELAVRGRGDGEEVSKLSYLEGEKAIADFFAGVLPGFVGADAIFDAAGFGGIDLDFGDLDFGAGL